MKRIALAAALVVGATAAAAQPTDVPRHKCEPKPDYPGRLAMQSENRRKGFDRDVKTYKDCIMGYIEDRKASIKANDSAANAAVEEYNALMLKLKADQEAANK